MSERLSKIARTLNVGISTITEFLQKKGFAVESNPNAKIDDEQYDLLIQEFGKDLNIHRERNKTHDRNKANKETQTSDDSTNIKNEPEVIKTEIPDQLIPHFNIIGNIDLENNIKKEEKEESLFTSSESTENIPSVNLKETISSEEIIPENKSEDNNEIDNSSTQPQNSNSKTEVKNKETEKVEKELVNDNSLIDIPQTNNSEGDLETSQIVEKEDIKEAESESVDTEVSTSKEGEIFRINNKKIESNIVVTGKIDLDSINDKTRPARKSKAQRKKERIEREQNAQTDKPTLVKKETTTDGPKKTLIKANDEENKKRKRQRISKEKVNIDKPGNYDASKEKDRRRTLKKPNKVEVSDEDVQKQIKETLARLTEKKGQKTGAKHRREKRDAFSQKQQEEHLRQEEESRILELTEFVTANDLANMMDVPVVQVISTCMSLGVMVAINQRLDAETINIVAEEFGYKTKFVSADVVEAINEEEDSPEDLVSRPPIVTVMGHVDHGKTSLLDNIRKTNIIAGEAGGITQHIGAYNVKLADGRKITFLDTPGHEAFTAMRARGAKVTDVAIIIVAADDSVMPQTVEAINHASAAGVPIVFAINKIDKPGANPDKIKERLAEMNYLVEEWGGKYQSQDISAKQGIGVNELLEKVLLEADLLELKANPERNSVGSVIESSLDKGRGYVATVLVENGTLKQGDMVLAGSYFGRVKAMFNERNQKISKAGPSEPALILGLNGAPQAGDKFHVLKNEQEARSIANRREQLQREQSIRTQKLLTLDDIGRRIAIGNFQQLNIIVKGDVDGSVEALSDSLIRLSTEEIQVNVIHKAVGQISESDITLAAASDAIIIGFQVRPSLAARKEAEKEGVDIRLYSIIYDAIEEVTAAMEGMLSPEIKEEVTANIEVREVFKITKVGTVAGCMVKDGKVKRSNKVRLVRDGIVIYTGELDSLKRFKDDVKEVTSGYECGLSIKNFNDIKVGDVVEAFEEIEVKKKL